MENNKQLLTEVRKAYRLLFDYQSKLLALVNYIGGKFGYNYAGGYPKFSNNQPRQGSGYLDNWAWDWLNLYFHEFRFRTDEKTNISFSIFLLNDDGFFQSCKEVENINYKEKTNLDYFKKPELSTSRLIFVVSHNSYISDFAIAERNWNTLQFTLEKKGFYTNEKGKLYFKSYPLENFFEESDVALQLNDFVRECHAVGIPFNQVEMKVG